MQKALSTNLDGPHRLSFDNIATMVAPERPGVFALGYVGSAGAFYVNYIGRSDADLRQRLFDSIGQDLSFKFETTLTPKEAFIRECGLYHAFRPPGNRLHPARPPLSGWTCPKCRQIEG